jgi:hypothetical protein
MTVNVERAFCGVTEFFEKCLNALKQGSLIPKKRGI